MRSFAIQTKKSAYAQIASRYIAANNNDINCDWNVLRTQLLQQWNKLSNVELEATGHNCRNIARLIEGKYGVPAKLAENYLRNFERTLPLLG